MNKKPLAVGLVRDKAFDLYKETGTKVGVGE